MATLTVTVESFQLAIAECADAITASDWPTATLKYAVASALHSGLELELGKGEANLKRRDSLRGLKEAIEFAKANISSSGDQRRLITTEMGY